MSVLNFLKNVKVKNRVDTYENWKNVNPVLLDGELAIVRFNKHHKIKVGNGTDNFNSLLYTDGNFIDTQFLKIGNNVYNGDIYGFVSGLSCDVSGNYSTVLGYQSKTTALDLFSFVWNGNNQSTDYYSAKGAGTFCINPIDSFGGFYIGDVSLQDKLEQLEKDIKNSDYTLTVYHSTERVKDVLTINTINSVDNTKTYKIKMSDKCNTFCTQKSSSVSILNSDIVNNYIITLQNICNLDEYVVLDFDSKYQLPNDTIVKVVPDYKEDESTLPVELSLSLYNSTGTKTASFYLNDNLGNPTGLLDEYFGEDSGEHVGVNFGSLIGTGYFDVDMSTLQTGNQYSTLSYVNKDMILFDSLDFVSPNTYPTDSEWNATEFNIVSGTDIDTANHSVEVKCFLVSHPQLMINVEELRRIFMRGGITVSKQRPNVPLSCTNMESIQLIGKLICTNIDSGSADYGKITNLYIHGTFDTRVETPQFPVTVSVTDVTTDSGTSEVLNVIS